MEAQTETAPALPVKSKTKPKPKPAADPWAARKVHNARLRTMAKAAMDTAKGVPLDAADKMVKALVKDREATVAAIWLACYQSCLALDSKVRVALREANGKPQSSSHGDRIEALALNNLMFYPLKGGIPLADADDDLIDESIGLKEKTAGTYAHDARWLQKVRDKKDDGVLVKDCLTAEQLHEFFEETANG